MSRILAPSRRVEIRPWGVVTIRSLTRGEVRALTQVTSDQAETERLMGQAVLAVEWSPEAREALPPEALAGLKLHEDLDNGSWQIISDAILDLSGLTGPAAEDQEALENLPPTPSS